ncbi:hypothetical protein LX87_04112 [Larkinella arboricola]|uniref:Uncharacterized protein n=1 Tax=Larkinella arboricola TaxID=643671 RepID=A0A327WSI3_LARAB|nr:hypothetical protein [Larkinella arboricola]RAJ94227.1 hypothetical protein LX87_04112 [Larkinella arboricola]
MLLVFSVVDAADGDIRPLVYYSERLELSFDLLSRYVRTGFTILSAVLREPNGVETSLPIEAIDGEPIKDYIQRLQKEWESILKKRP